MIDPWTSLSTASALVGLVTFGVAILDKMIEMRSAATGTVKDVEALENMAGRLRQEAIVLTNAPLGHNSELLEDEQRLNQITAECIELVDRLLASLTGLHVGPSRSARKIMVAAFRSERKKSDLARYRLELNDKKAEIVSVMLRVTNNKTGSIILALRNFKDNQSSANTTMLKELSRLRVDVEQTLERQQAVASSQTQVLHDAVKSLVSEGRKVDARQRILASLNFEQMPQRFEQIPERHTRTYEWTLHESLPRATDSSRKSASLIDWLKSGKGIFWISGKPGSGKSTSMKFICDHESTRTALEAWATPSSLVTASFFFWNAGTILQKSLLGLWRSLCLQILQKCPSLIETVCPERWAELMAKPAGGTSEWTLAELRRLMERLRAQEMKVDGRSVRFCFFIDGLDEYDGDEEHISSAIQEIATFDNIKLCVSSRPWNVFDDAFRAQSLVLQDFNKADIRQFVTDELGRHPRFITMRDEDPDYSALLDDIVEKADSVFLWVFLVVRELRRSLTNGDGLNLLRRRVQHMPADLDEYFQHMFNRLESFYNQQTAQTFLMRINSPVAPPLISFCVIDPDNERVRSLLAADHIDAGWFLWLEDDLRKHINSRCRDLLEVTNVKGHPTVSYLHRTVRDFLRTPSITKLLEERAGNEFEPDVTLLEASTLALRHIHHLADQPWAHTPYLVNTVLYHAHTLEKKHHIVSWDQINATGAMLHERSIHDIKAHLAHPYSRVELRDMQDWFLARVVRHELYGYLDLRFTAQPRLITSGDVDYLWNVARSLRNDEPVHELSRDASRPDSVVEALIKEGCCNSDRVSQASGLSTGLWVPFLRRVHYLRAFFTPQLKTNFKSMVESMIEAGAVTTCAVPIEVSGQMIAMTEERVLCDIFGNEETGRLLSLRAKYSDPPVRRSWIPWLWKGG